jgi:hypothetical protein
VLSNSARSAEFSVYYFFFIFEVEALIIAFKILKIHNTKVVSYNDHIFLDFFFTQKRSTVSDIGYLDSHCTTYKFQLHSYNFNFF